MISGKTHLDILVMTIQQRHHWYKILDFSEKEEAMKLVKTVQNARSSITNQGVRNPMYGKTVIHSEETRAKISIGMTGEKNSMYGKSTWMKGRTHSTESLAKMSESHKGASGPMKGRKHSAKSIAKMSASHKGHTTGMKDKTHSPETRAKLSAISSSKTGKDASNWQGGKSFEPYCPLFNETKREEIRNRDKRKCQLCDKSEILNGQRLSVHHIDGDKMQGCNNKRWGLVALCYSCNSKTDTLEKEFLIVSNLNSQPRSRPTGDRSRR